ncbi:MAG: dynamin family protein [Nostocaceae cyanobacterium]|nr:dynamin family protein [Nostocaceae cyanobacterium]
MESLNRYIHYNLTNLRQEFVQIINDFSEGLSSEKVKNAIGTRLIKHIQTQINQILTRLEAEFVLVVIGDFKRGKSTLINALLGEAVVTTDVTPETVTINHIQYGPETKINICLTDSGQMSLEIDELKSERLNPILENFVQPISHLKIETPIEWLRGLRLVDTPGTGDIFKRFDRQVHTYLLQADAVIFVGSALAPFSQAEQAFLELSVIPRDFPKVFFVLNMMDNIRTEKEAERLLKNAQKKISRLFPNAQLFGLSAFDEFCRLQSLSRPNSARALTLEKSFQEFREYLSETILLQRDLIQLDRATDRMEQMLQEFEDSLLLLCNAMQADRSNLSRAINQCEDPTSELFDKIAQHTQVMKDEINQMCDQACEWIKEFVDRLEKEAITAIPNFKIEDIKRHFQFFMTNSLWEAINKCLDFHQPTIFENANQAQKAIFTDFQLLTDVSGIISQTTIEAKTDHQQPPINFDTFEILTDCDPSTFVAELIVSKTKDLGTSRQAVNYQQELQNAMPEFKLALIQEIRSLYNNIATKIEQQIESVYQQNIEASLSVMQQAQEVCAQEAQQVTVTNQVLQESLLLLNNSRSKLKILKQKIYSEDILEDMSRS